MSKMYSGPFDVQAPMGYGGLPGLYGLVVLIFLIVISVSIAFGGLFTSGETTDAQHLKFLKRTIIICTILSCILAAFSIFQHIKFKNFTQSISSTTAQLIHTKSNNIF